MGRRLLLGELGEQQREAVVEAEEVLVEHGRTLVAVGVAARALRALEVAHARDRVPVEEVLLHEKEVWLLVAVGAAVLDHDRAQDLDEHLVRVRARVRVG